MKQLKSSQGAWRLAGAYSLVEVVVAVFVLGIMAVGLFGAFSSGLSAVQAARENLRASQILMQKTEAIRLFNWSQSTNSALASPAFIDFYDPTGTNTGHAGVLYRGTVSITPGPTNLPAAYRNQVRLVTVTLYWTNYIGKRQPVVNSRQMHTYTARFGMQNYVY